MGIRMRLASVAWCAVLNASVSCFAQNVSAPAEAVPNVQLNVNRVMVPVVVRNRQGQAIADLKQDDFRVLDNGKPRTISGFTVLEHTIEDAKAVRDANGIAPASTATTADTGTMALPERVVVMVFDDLHLNGEELVYAKKAAAMALKDTLSETDIGAVVSISGAVNSGLTHDAAKLQAALDSIKPHAIFRSETNACGNIDYYQADLIENKRDSVAFNDALQKQSLCNPAIHTDSGDLAMAESLVHASALRALALGNHDVRSTFTNLEEFVERVGKLPGQHTMILVSPGFLNIEPETQRIESQILNEAAQTGVTINALDARGLYSSELSASERGPGAGGANPEYRRTEMRLQEDPMAELADGTGGRFFHNSNDLTAGMKSLTAGPETAYLLELSLDGVKADGAYHQLKVTVDREGMDVQARRGYPMPKANKKKR